MTLPKDPEKVQQYRDKQARIAKARWTPERKEKMSLAHKGKTISPEHRLKISQANKGQPCSEETKLKMSIVQKGKTRSAEHKLKNSLAQKGRTHSKETKLKIAQTHQAKWEGIETEASLHPRQAGSYEYREWRTQVFERDDYTCRDCEVKGGELNAHHIFQWSFNELFRFLLWNGVTMCVKCHKKIKVHHKKKVLHSGLAREDKP